MRAGDGGRPVGDDQFGEDPTVNRLQELVAALLGKEAALFVPSGHMANQLALKLFTRPGDDVVISRESHAAWHETGAGAANSGVQFTEIGDDGVFTAEEFLAARKPRGHFVYPPTTLVEVEDTHNRAGGVVFPPAEMERIVRRGARARRRHVPRRRAASERGGRARRRPGGARGAVRPRRDQPLEGARRARRLGARRTPRRSWRRSCATGGCSAARCARSASSPPPASTPSSTTSSGSPRITPTRG